MIPIETVAVYGIRALEDVQVCKWTAQHPQIMSFDVIYCKYVQ